MTGSPASLIYLDNHATTRLAPEALQAMLPYLEDQYGNAGSAHPLGHRAEAAVARSREQLAALLGCSGAELVFNSGGTEGLNHVFRGVFEAFPARRRFVISAVEHSAVVALAEWLRAQGAQVDAVPVDRQGALDLGALEALLGPETALCSVMAANNETGVRFPMEAVSALCRERGVLFHVDATQAVGKVPVPLKAWGADLANLSAHKFHGPKGVGALFLRRGLRLRPFVLGGGQERGRRGGTENVPGIVGLGAAAELAQEALPRMEGVAALRDHLERGLLEALPGSVAQGAASPRLPTAMLMSFPGIQGEDLLLRLAQSGVCASVGSACSTGRHEPSHVLRAMGVPPEEARGTLRFSLSRYTTAEEIQRAGQLIRDLVAELKRDRPLARGGACPNN